MDQAAGAGAGRRPWLLWALPAAVAAVSTLWRIGSPSLSTDELATWSAASRSPGELFHLLTHVDAVIGVYYFAMHWWSVLFGPSTVALRLPGAAAIVASAGLTAVLGRRLTTWTDGLLAGLVFAILPATARTGQDIRVYAFTILFALIATLALIRVTRYDVSRRAWAGYAAALVALGYLHLVAFALLMPAHLVVLSACARRHRSRVRPTLLALVATALLLLPLAVAGWEQRRQLDWVGSVGAGVFGRALVNDLAGSWPVAAALAVLGVFGVVRGGRWRWPLLVWALAPIVLISAIGVWVPRYALIALPAWALLAGRALGRSGNRPDGQGVGRDVGQGVGRGLGQGHGRGRWVAIGGLVVLLVIGLPAELRIRGDDGHDFGTRAAAGLIAREWRPGDALVYRADSWTSPLMVAYYRPGVPVSEPLVARAAVSAGWYTGDAYPPSAERLAGVQRLWFVRRGDHAGDPLGGRGDLIDPMTAIQDGFTVQQVWSETGLTVILLVHR